MPEKNIDKSTATLERNGYALIQCLDYLECVAKKSGFVLTAHMLTLAKDATHETIDKTDDEGSEPIALLPAGNGKHGNGSNGARRRGRTAVDVTDFVPGKRKQALQ